MQSIPKLVSTSVLNYKLSAFLESHFRCTVDIFVFSSCRLPWAAALSDLVHTGGSGLLSPGRENFKESFSLGRA